MTKPEIDPAVAEAIEEALREVAALRPADPVAFVADKLAAKSQRTNRYELDWACPNSTNPFSWVPTAYFDYKALKDLNRRVEDFWQRVLEDPEHLIDRRALAEVYPELYYFTILEDDSEEASAIDAICEAIRIIKDVVTADPGLLPHFRPFDGVGDYRRTIGHEYSRHSVAQFLGAMIPGLVGRAKGANSLEKLVPNIHDPFHPRGHLVPLPDDEVSERDVLRIKDGRDWMQWDTVAHRLDLLTVRLILLRLLEKDQVHEKLDQYTKDYSEHSVWDGMGPKDGSGKYYSMLVDSPRLLSLFPSFKKLDTEHKSFILSWLRTGFPLRDLPCGRFVAAHFHIFREETLTEFPPLSLEIVVQGLVSEAVYDHWDDIITPFDPDIFSVEVQIAAEAMCVCRYYRAKAVMSYLGLRYKHVITPACLKLGHTLPSQWWEASKAVKRTIVKLSYMPRHFVALRNVLHGKVLTEDQLISLITQLNKDGMTQRPALLLEGVVEYLDACIDNQNIGPSWGLATLANILARAGKVFGKLHPSECLLVLDLSQLAKSISDHPDEYGFGGHLEEAHFDEVYPIDRGPLIRRTGRIIPFLAPHDTE
ncbi:hypothetical protein FOL47_004231 [Perkinsus chesapeaki]|uniref:Uncharacterized protein n=1 Tax=Perkinsus chesapeaki TaxID=330153 RepID=A0A7J6M3Q8_PERCH|nr:hypothetical protein FOL47_004231 [Perkinsus chesapeaki]